MKAAAIVIIVCISFSLLPLAGSSPRLESKRLCLAALDLCNPSVSGIQSGHDIPFLTECPCKPVAAEIVCLYKISIPGHKPLLISLRQDPPPES
jgi:hypothetical protein